MKAYDLEQRIHEITLARSTLTPPDDDDLVAYPTETDRLEAWEEHDALVLFAGERALAVLRVLAGARKIGMAEVANLVAAARSKNGHQLSAEDKASLMAAERIISRISGAYTVPLLFDEFVHLPPRELPT